MNIGEASKASKVSAKMIRYYEQIGLIPRPTGTIRATAPIARTTYTGCTSSGVRATSASVAEITDLLGLWNDKSRRSADVKRLAQQHISELDRRIASMLEMAETLKALIRCCAGDERPDCPILHTLEQLDTSDDEPEARTGAVPRRASGNAAAKKPRAH